MKWRLIATLSIVSRHFRMKISSLTDMKLLKYRLNQKMIILSNI